MSVYRSSECSVSELPISEGGSSRYVGSNGLDPGITNSSILDLRIEKRDPGLQSLGALWKFLESEPSYLLIFVITAGWLSHKRWRGTSVNNNDNNNKQTREQTNRNCVIVVEVICIDIVFNQIWVSGWLTIYFTQWIQFILSPLSRASKH